MAQTCIAIAWHYTKIDFHILVLKAISTNRPISPVTMSALLWKKFLKYKIIFLYCCRQFRLTNGSAITGTFQATDTLETVCAYINENRTDGSTPFKLMTTFPRKTYTDGDLGMSLQDAGLVPSAVLILTKIWIILLNTILACFRLNYISVL